MSLSKAESVSPAFASSHQSSPSDCHGIDAVQLVPGGVNIASVEGEYEGVISHADLTAVYTGEKKIEDVATVRRATIKPADAQPGTP